MNITIYIDKDGSVTVTDLSGDILEILKDSFFDFNSCHSCSPRENEDKTRENPLNLPKKEENKIK